MIKSNNTKVKYPMLQVNLENIYKNVKSMVDLCNSNNINIAGVVKGFNGLPRVVEEFIKGGCKFIADSRMDQIIGLKEAGINAPLMLIRIPMLSEIEELVQYVDISLNSEIETLNSINLECKKQGKRHKVVLMMDVGDLREGVMEDSELIDMALYVENKLENIDLAGIGTNMGCYGSIKPTEDNLGRLCRLAEEIESKIGRELEIVSGGASSSIPLMLSGKMPKKINNLRIGEAIILNRDLEEFWECPMKNMNKDTFILNAQVVEVKCKPSYPIGEMCIDAFGNTPVYEDNGMRKRVLLAVGKQDFGFHDKLIPRKEGVIIVGSSSDHLILDVEDCKEEIKIGDILQFDMYYPPMIYLTGYSPIPKIYI